MVGITQYAVDGEVPSIDVAVGGADAFDPLTECRGIAGPVGNLCDLDRVTLGRRVACGKGGVGQALDVAEDAVEDERVVDWDGPRAAGVVRVGDQ